jgi:hypothetical protein
MGAIRELDGAWRYFILGAIDGTTIFAGLGAQPSLAAQPPGELRSTLSR